MGDARQKRCCGAYKMKHYVTFGQAHRHVINGLTFDKDCVCVIEATNPIVGRKFAEEYFGNIYGRFFNEEDFKQEEHMPFYPRGLININ